MKTPSLVVAALAAGLSLAGAGAGCSSTDACLDLACADSANVTLTALATQIAASLPATVTVCLGDSCTAFRIDHTGAAPICTALSVGPGLCTIDGEGNVILTSLPLPTGTTSGASIAVHATATDSKSVSLFDATQMTAVSDWPPDRGTCPPQCHHVEAIFASS